MVERKVWERVNEARHSRYTRSWKEFYRRWLKERTLDWPSSKPFWSQHRELAKAVPACGLPMNPLAAITKPELVNEAIARLTSLGFNSSDVAAVLPPIEEMLP